MFICPGYDHIRLALLERGWQENLDYNSPVFHLKLSKAPIDVQNLARGKNVYMNGGVGKHELKDFQKINHFCNNVVLTSKLGLTESLRGLHLWDNSTSMDHIFPKCFTLHRNDLTGALSKTIRHKSDSYDDETFELERFTQEYRAVFAESLLKNFVAEYYSDEPIEFSYQVLVALQVTERRLMTFDDELEQLNEITSQQVCSDKEWSVLKLSKTELAKRSDVLAALQYTRDLS